MSGSGSEFSWWTGGNTERWILVDHFTNKRFDTARQRTRRRDLRDSVAPSEHATRTCLKISERWDGTWRTPTDKCHSLSTVGNSKEQAVLRINSTAYLFPKVR
jgi:hypothetical protein